jgi:hypothetical protein
MKLRNLFLALLLTSFAHAKNVKATQGGTLLQMESVQCGTDQASSTSFAGEILGTDSNHKKTRVLLCPEYVLQADRNTYRIRPKDEKHPVLLSIGQQVQFRTEKDQLKLRAAELGEKERGFVVLSIKPRASAEVKPASTPEEKPVSIAIETKASN